VEMFVPSMAIADQQKEGHQKGQTQMVMAHGKICEGERNKKERNLQRKR
jgi:hypothetical protein